MPPKADPYATKSARAVDLLLVLVALIVIALAILTAPKNRHGAGGSWAPTEGNISLAANIDAH